MVRLAIGASTGGELLLSTMTVNVFASDRCCVLTAEGLKSVTRMVKRFVVPPCSSIGVQTNTPVFVSRFAPATGAESNVNVSAFAGTSKSKAVFVNDNVVVSKIVKSGMAVSTGG